MSVKTPWRLGPHARRGRHHPRRPPRPGHAVAALADGPVVSASYDRTLRVWDLARSEAVAVFTLDAIPLTVAIDASGVVAGVYSGRVHFFDVVG